MTTAPILRATHVRRPPGETFGLFTDRIGAWWPLVSHGMFGADSAGVAFDGERLVERSVDGRRVVWAEVLEWEPGRRLVLAWHPGREDGPASRLELRFLEDAEGTRVELVHGGWEAFGDEAGTARSSYAGRDAWGRVLDHLADVAERSAEQDADLAALAAAYEAFFIEAAGGGFAAPANGGDPHHPDFSAEQVVAHVAVNDDLMSAVCRAVMEGAGHPDGVRPPAPFVNDVSNDRAVLDALVTAHHGDLTALVETGRSRAEQLRLLLSRLDADEREVLVQARLSSDGEVMVDDPMPWGRLAITVQATRHLPGHRDQLRALRRRGPG